MLMSRKALMLVTSWIRKWGKQQMSDLACLVTTHLLCATCFQGLATKNEEIIVLSSQNVEGNIVSNAVMAAKFPSEFIA